MPAFNVCMGEKLSGGASLTLNECNNKALQKFDFTSKNRIKVFGKHDLCVAVGSENQGKEVVALHLI